MKRCIAMLLIVLMLVGILPKMSAETETQYATVIGGWLRLRSEASFNARTITSYYTGTQIRILGSTGNWYHVETPDGRRGYMCADFLTINSNTVNTNATIVSGNGYGVRLRRGPSTSYRVIGKYPVGTRAQILESGKYWCRITVNGTTGYMMSQFLSKDGASTTVYVDDAVIFSNNGYGVRLRTGPGKSYSKIGTYSVGTPVKIIQKGETWDYVQIGSRVGYMMNEFLIYNSNTSLKGVTINNMSPVIGNILAVHTLNPASATVTFEWMRKDADGNVTTVGTNAAYSVTSADAGCALQLRVTGCGKYVGSAVSGYTTVVKDSRSIDSLTLDNLNPVIGDTLTPKTEPTDATYTCKWEVNGKEFSDSSYTVSESDKGYPVKLTVTGTGAFEGSTKTVETAAVASKGTVEAVTIVNETSPTASAPNVGDKLSAQVTPATATVTYEWTVLSGTTPVKSFTDSSITVAEDYKGCVIQLKVKGSGSYDGEASVTTPAITNNIQLTGVSINGDAQPVVKNDAASVLSAVISPAGATVDYHWYAGETEVGTGSQYTVSANDAGKTITVKAVGTGDYCGSVTSSATAAVAVAHSFLEIKESGNNIVGYEYSVEFGGNGTSPSTWTLTGSIPGMTIAGNKISGQPSAAGDYKINVKVSNAAGESAFGDYTLTIMPAQQKPVVSAPSKTIFYLNQSIGEVKFTATEGPILSWTLSGTLSSGLSLDANTGTLSGTPTAAGSYTVSVTATNKTGTSDAVTYTFMVLDQISLSGYDTTYEVENGSEVNFTVTAAGGSGSFVWSITPADSFLIADGVVTAGDLEEGVYSVTVTATDAADATLLKSTEVITITVEKPQPELPDITINCSDTYSFPYEDEIKIDLSAAGGSGSYIWSLSSGSEDENRDDSQLFTITDGVLTPAGELEAGEYLLIVTAADASDSNHKTSTNPITIKVEPEENSSEQPENSEADENALPSATPENEDEGMENNESSPMPEEDGGLDDDEAAQGNDPITE